MSNYKIFDFDDTLVRTGARIYVKRRDGSKIALTPSEWAQYKLKAGETPDFRDFRGDKLFDPKGVKYYIKILKNVLNSGGTPIILSARGDPRPIAKFLRSIGIRSGISIVIVDSTDVLQAAIEKADYIEKLITRKKAKSIEFFDDSLLNIKAVEKLKKKYPNVKIITRKVPSYHQ